MRNRAKCKLCQQIIESFHSTDYVVCKCDEIAVDGGEALRCYAKDWNNFLRILDDNSEFAPEIIMSKDICDKPPVKPDKAELLRMLEATIQSYENLPQHALNAPATNADLLSFMLLMDAILKT